MLAVRLAAGRSGLVGLRAAAAAAMGGARRSAAGSAADYKFETLAVSEPKKHVYYVKLNRPEKLNAMNKVCWREIGECFDQLGEDSSCRAVVLGGEGRMFTAGIDLMDFVSIGTSTDDGEDDPDVARKGRNIHKFIRGFQHSFSALERCPKPVITAVHGACIGAGVDLICGADIRYSTTDAWFQVKEVEVGLAADVGTLQRLPKVVGGQSLARELVFTARKMHAPEALQCGFVSRTFESKESLEEGALEVASTIASMSPVAVQTSKLSLIYSRDHSVDDGLDHVAKLNMLMLQSDDVRISAMAMMSKGETKAVFSKL